jgi:predicted dehydrogenase
LITLDPGHFHASLVQKATYPQVSPEVFVYSPGGEDLQQHLQRIESFNSRADDPTHWREKVYVGPDFLSRMAEEKPGNVVVISGNNRRKTEYIDFSVRAGLHVLADKPMAINPEGFKLLRKAFDRAQAQRTLLYDIMTERYEITAMLQRELAQMPEIFGKLVKGTHESPAVSMSSLHFFFKEVAGKPLVRPGWFFDVRQEGEAIPDVGTHLIDLVQWTCFPEVALDWRKDVRMLAARRWATRVSAAQYKQSTGLNSFPDFLMPDLDSQGVLNVFQNGEVHYTLRGIHTRVTALWDFQPPAGAKDTFESTVRGTKATIRICQGPEENYVPRLYVECVDQRSDFAKTVAAAVEKLAQRWPGLSVKAEAGRCQIVIPEKYNVGHEAHFAEVTRQFLRYLADGKMPQWEVANMLAKYYTTTEAYRISRE